MLSFQKIDKHNFNIFIRDLSENLNANIKHMIEDYNKINRVYYEKDYDFYNPLDKKPKTKPSDLVPSVYIFKKRYKKI